MIERPCFGSAGDEEFLVNTDDSGTSHCGCWLRGCLYNDDYRVISLMNIFLLFIWLWPFYLVCFYIVVIDIVDILSILVKNMTFPDFMKNFTVLTKDIHEIRCNSLCLLSLPVFHECNWISLDWFVLPKHADLEDYKHNSVVISLNFSFEVSSMQ